MGLGHATSMKWLIEGEVRAGTFCTTQGMSTSFHKFRHSCDCAARYFETIGRSGCGVDHPGNNFISCLATALTTSLLGHSDANFRVDLVAKTAQEILRSNCRWHPMDIRRHFCGSRVWFAFSPTS